MALESPSTKTPAAEADLTGVADLLGAQRWIDGGVLENPFELHDQLVRGLSGRALKYFIRRCPHLAQDPAFARILGLPPAPHEGPLSGRSGRLSSHESGQLWRLAVILATAAALFGGIEAAQRWLLQPAIGLGQRHPLDLLETPPGYQLVCDHLTQLKFGVYV